MSLFNFRRAGSSSAANAAPGAQTESVEVMRRRAKHRLIGSAVLVLIGVVGFPLLFDTQPRPIAIDIPIEIPGKSSVKPLALPAASPQSVASAAKASSAVATASAPTAAPVPRSPAEKVAAALSLGAREEILTEKKPVAPVKTEQVATKTEAKEKAEAKAATRVEPAAPKPEVKVVSKPPPAVDDANRVKALLDGKPEPVVAATGAKSASAAAVTEFSPASTPAEGRMIVQVGAFADVEKAREARTKLEKAGLKTYTQVVETAGGKRIRVRVGPFATKAEADKAASKIKTLDLPASVLTL